MSVIVEDEKGRILLYCKGADSILLERMNKAKNPDIPETMRHLSEFADEGLRTLLIAYKVIPRDAYDVWYKNYLQAATAPEKREEKMEVLQDELETDMLLIGATAIEDRLQDEVGSTIAFLKSAGIKVWVLTGDKIETAINIGFSCNLLNKELKRLIVDGKGEAEVKKSINEAQAKVDKRKTKYPTDLKIALIVSGDALIEAMKAPLSAQLMQIADLCEAVICCRVAPKQKAEVVMLVRKTKPQVSTLSIGDGANDVNMITAAHVGVGIRGVEGQQAARASDYAFGEFKFLKRLLVFHGRESYRKNSTLILYNFYKNILLVLPVFWVGFDMSFSGQRIYENWLYSLFNVFYASLPIVLYALLDRQFENKNKPLMDYPALYEPGLKSRYFNKKRFWLWFLNAIIHSVILGIFSIYILESTFIYNKGYTGDMWTTGAMILALCVAMVNFKILTFTYAHTPLTLFIIFASIGVYVLSFLIVNFLSGNEFEEMFKLLYTLPYFYFGCVVIVVPITFFDLGKERYYHLIERKKFKKMKADYTAKKLQEELKKKEEIKTEGQNISATNRPKEEIIMINKGESTPSAATASYIPLTINNRKSYEHTGYAFSQEERKSWFRINRKGLDHPQY